MFKKDEVVHEKYGPVGDLIFFGIRQDKGNEGRPILWRPDKHRCSKCNGFGTYGNPLCGAVYTCKSCNGSGYSWFYRATMKVYQYFSNKA